jgi:hypothetical protein
MIANLGYTLPFGVHDHAILARSLIADIALPLLLIAHIPAFFGPNRAERPAGHSPATALPPHLGGVRWLPAWSR